MNETVGQIRQIEKSVIFGTMAICPTLMQGTLMPIACNKPTEPSRIRPKKNP